MPERLENRDLGTVEKLKVGNARLTGDWKDDRVIDLYEGDGVTLDDINQASLGDCYFIGIASSHSAARPYVCE